MNTPIYDFVKAYTSSTPARLHMPGHKGRGPLGCEALDITEIPGADSLYEAAGIIAESEANASQLFGCPTFYSTEGSSHCIRAMLLLAMQSCHSKPCPEQRRRGSEESALPAVQEAEEDGGSGSFDSASLRSGRQNRNRFCILAARNCHKAFLSAAALLDLDVIWLPASEDSYLSAQPTPELLDAALAESEAGAVYLTCPDYLGFLPELAPLAEVCHAHGALLLVDNAHGAYLRFLKPSQHPMDLGADLCCDSAHKTLPVLTGGAYLHVAKHLILGAGRETRPLQHGEIREALALFGSSSPSYLILQSLDLANSYLETLPERLAGFLPKLDALKARLRAAGWTVVGDEPLKLTLSLAATAETSPVNRGGGSAARPVERCRPSTSAASLAAALEQAGIYCEFFDADYLVCMLSPENSEEELRRLATALLDIDAEADGRIRTSNACPCVPDYPKCCTGCGRPMAAPTGGSGACGRPNSQELRRMTAPTDVTSSVIRLAGDGRCHLPLKGKAMVCSLRAAMLAPAVTIPAQESLGRVLARPGVSCPPAVPILMPGERIDEATVAAFAEYGIQSVFVLP